MEKIVDVIADASVGTVQSGRVDARAFVTNRADEREAAATGHGSGDGIIPGPAVIFPPHAC
jgi:hypothetical protein